MLFKSTLPVLFISRNKLVFSLVTFDKKPKVAQVLESANNSEQLVTFFNQAKKIAQTNKWFVLIADDVSYLLELSFPKGSQYTRSEVKQAAHLEIPEKLAEDGWDFVEGHPTATGDIHVLVFAPVQHIWLPVQQLLRKMEIEVVAMESESLAKTRHSNPSVGIVLKSDIAGKDAKTLNIHTTSKHSFFTIFLIGFAVVILLITVAVVWLVYLGRSS